MKQKFQDDLKKVLLKKQKELNNRMEQLKVEASNDGEPISADFEEQAVERESEEVIEEVSRVTRHELAEIRVALERINQGTYGVCAECGDDIPMKRLEALPFAMYCTDCQEYVDQVNK
jgi:DnaK suppressor protein